MIDLSVESLSQSILNHLHRMAHTEQSADTQAWYQALASALSEQTNHDLISTEQFCEQHALRHVNYLSMEFLIGRLTANNLINMDLYQLAQQTLAQWQVELADVLEQERDPALGNGGLGRLAACYLDGLVSQGYPAVGYGLHYEYGLFKQYFESNQQRETADCWQGERGYPWQVKRPELNQEVGFFGHVEVYRDEQGKMRRRWHTSMNVKGVAWDIPVLGYRNQCVMPLRLWEAQAIEPFEFERFDASDYTGAHQSQIDASNITQLLYPNDNHQQGKRLRLMQQYFHCACSLRDILRRHLGAGHRLETLPQLQTIQLNDTHPAIAIPELMRLLLDEYHYEWKQAWQICQQTFAYTNHTLLPEALERWSEALIKEVLPRHMEIIFEINYRLLLEVDKHWPDDIEKRSTLSIIQEQPYRQVRMANLCVAGSYKVNGVAAMHSELVKQNLFPEFDALYPNRLCNVTNGITPRRWLKQCNPALASWLDRHVGEQWPLQLDDLRDIEPLATQPQAQQEYMAIKRQNKQRLAAWVEKNLGIALNVDAIFDVQIKRLHEYKRQHLNLLHILSLYYRILHEPDFEMHPRVFIFAAKAAPGYVFAKQIIHAINCVAQVINQDERVGDKLKIVFIPDYRVSVAELIVPAADVSEQISMAGKEASGTGNMKLALNGAITMGTLDGANVEIAEEVGDENLFIFGLTVEEIDGLDQQGYQPMHFVHCSPLLTQTLDFMMDEQFGHEVIADMAAIRHNLEHADPYKVLADFDAYVAAQKSLEESYLDTAKWAEMAMLNTARMGKFSSDRSIQDYVNQIWRLQSIESVHTQQAAQG
ncbi:Maltodextrin phosphorylase [Vibrio stylophorae]|uniref:Alpha-1,4 glucan phosphorylase n=1 Tax=Vibrio stylophorae TaxID=659351 RepID=A0ABM8ZYF7_9VIBR|nr:glycogen/starch/alpha-glucan phosphorylase [Vibrio stylophorae]CAH0535785.1 Maltodextrin phosphorylase [Vibrio stylophorae]